LELTLTYLSDRDIEPDGQSLLQQELRTRLDYPQATIRLVRFPVSSGRLVFRNGNSSLDRTGQEVLDSAAEYLQQHTKLRLEIAVGISQNPQEESATQEKLSTIKEYLSTKAQIPGERIVLKPLATGETDWSLSLGLAE
jgi:hypothetical protein